MPIDEIHRNKTKHMEEVYHMAMGKPKPPTFEELDALRKLMLRQQSLLMDSVTAFETLRQKARHWSRDEIERLAGSHEASIRHFLRTAD